MRVKKYDHLLQVRINPDVKRRLERAGQELDLNMAETVRLSLRLGLLKLLTKLPATEAGASE